MGLFNRRRQEPADWDEPPQADLEVTYHVRQPRARDDRYADPDAYDPLPVLTLRRWDYGQGEGDDAEGYGFETPDGKIWASGQCQWSRWPELGVLQLKVIGVKYHQDVVDSVLCDPGRPMLLVPEPDNPHDPKAISIRDAAGEQVAGYVKAGSCSRLRNMLRSREFRVMSLACRSAGGHRTGLKLVVFRPGRLLGAEHVPPHPPL